MLSCIDILNMSEMEESNLNETDSKQVSLPHMESSECDSPECQKEKTHYVQILDMDRYINTLSDWD